MLTFFDRLFRHWGFAAHERRLGRFLAGRYRAAKRVGKSDHIRDPRSGQWRGVFTPEVRKRFDARYGPLVEKLGYPAD